MYVVYGEMLSVYDDNMECMCIVWVKVEWYECEGYVCVRLEYVECDIEW